MKHLLLFSFLSITHLTSAQTTDNEYNLIVEGYDRTAAAKTTII
ncbi:MAG: hypothetical protein AAGG68_13160 [Bacteroidota bacterium]